MTKLVKFLELAPREQALFLRAWFLLGYTRTLLWLLPFRTLQELVKRKRIRQPAKLVTGVENLKRALAVMSRYIPRCTCLIQALAMSLLLKRYGYPSHLLIGVARNEDGKFLAHAWVESQGQIVIGGSKVDQFTPFSPLL
jgi:Transglutaminase-like superfamily